MGGSRFSALFEALVIDWLLEASFAALARELRLSWDQVAGIQDRAVRRGLARRNRKPPTRAGGMVPSRSCWTGRCFWTPWGISCASKSI